MSFEMRIVCFILVLFGFGNDQVIANIRGTPGIDYPSYSSIPRTSFKCSDQEKATGFYADPETRCQVFHYCYENRQETFLCPIGTTFNQAINSCDYWYSSECDSIEVLHVPEEPDNGYNDQPFVPVTRPPYNVYEKMIALRDSNGNLYEQDGFSFIQPGNPQNENGDYFIGSPTPMGDLEKIPETGELDLDFVPYDHDAVGTDDIEIVFSKDEQLKAMHTDPNFDYADEEDSYSQEDFNVPDESDNFPLDTGETLLRMYQKEHNSEKQVKEMVDIDPKASHMDVSNFVLNSDSMLQKRFSEVESKKRRIRRKPKYVVLQTNFAENSESQKSDPEHEAVSSSKNSFMVTYALDTNEIVLNENSVGAIPIEHGKFKKNRKSLRKDHNYSIDDENLVADIDYSEDSDSQNDQLKFDTLDKMEINPHVIKETSDLNFHELENTNINVVEENNNSGLHMENSDSNNIFTLNDAVFLENQHINLEEPMETEESYLESDTINPDGIEVSKDQNNYQVHELSDLGESNFIQEHAEETSSVGNLFSESENVATSFGMFNLNESSDSSTDDMVESETLNNESDNIANTEFEGIQNNQNYLESSKESISNDIINNGNNMNLEFMNDIALSEKHKFEDTNTELKREGNEDSNSGSRINSKYLSFEKNDSERSRLKESESVEDYVEDSIHSSDDQDGKHFKDTHTETEINVDSLEYFESEGQGYFMDEYGRIYIISGENEESETLIYVGDIASEENVGIDSQDISLPEMEESYQATEDSYLPTEAEASFNLIDSTENEFGTDDVKPEDINESTEDNLDYVLDEEEDQRPENLLPQKEDSELVNFDETLAEHNITALHEIFEETDVSQSDLNQTNATTDYPVDTNVGLLKDIELKDVKSPQTKEELKNVIELIEANNDKMAQDLDKPIDSQFHLSSIPLPANDYEKGLYDEKVKSDQRDSDTINSMSPATFYKELQAVPVTEKNNLAESKTVGDFPTAELLDIKSRLFRNIRSDLASPEVKSAVVDVGFPSKVVDNLFSSFSSPLQSVQGNNAGYFPLHSPKFRTLPHFPTRTGKKFKPSKIFRLIIYGKKLLKMKRAKLNTLKEYFSF